jgi:hypothetical protein
MTVAWMMVVPMVERTVERTERVVAQGDSDRLDVGQVCNLSGMGFTVGQVYNLSEKGFTIDVSSLSAHVK